MLLGLLALEVREVVERRLLRGGHDQLPPSLKTTVPRLWLSLRRLNCTSRTNYVRTESISVLH